MTRLSRSSVLALAALSVLLFLTIASSAQAQTQQPGFGEIVPDMEDEDAEHVFSTSGAPDRVSFRDSDGDGTLDGTEPVYLTRSSTTQQGDVRLADPLEGSSFTKIGSGDSDHDLSITSLSGTIRFYDADHDESISPGDTVYYDLDSTQDGKVSSRDVILAGEDAGEKAGSGHPHTGIGLNDPRSTARFGSYDTDDDGNYDDSDAAIVDTGDDGYLTVGDLRLGSTAGGSGGTIISAGDGDVTYRLSSFDDTWGFEHRDPNSNDEFGVSEPAYISTGDQVATFAVRIANPPSEFSSGSKVIEQDHDWRLETMDLSGSLAHDSAGDFDDTSTLYYDVDNDNGVDRGDFRLTGDRAGEAVTGGDDDVGTSLDSYNGDLHYFDANGNGAYDGADIVYADTDNDDIVKSYDVQLSDARDPYNPDDDGDDGTDATVTIGSHGDGDEVVVNETVALSGTADGGDSQVTSVEVAVTGGEHDLGDVNGTGEWSAEFTPREAVDYTITATAELDSGSSVETSLELQGRQIRDSDEDGLADPDDNCPQTPNEDQSDTDDDGQGDACDDDIDGDGIANRVDECEQEPGETADEGCPAQDSDDDGVADGDDECPEVAGTEANDGCPEDQDTGNETDGNETGDEDDGVPAPGAAIAVVAVSMTALALRRRVR